MWSTWTRALSEPGLVGQMLFQASLSAPGRAAVSPTQPLCRHPCNSRPFSQLFDVPVGLAESGPAKAPSSVSTDPSVSSPGQPVLLRGRALQVQMTSMSPPSAWPYVLDGPETRQDLCQPPEPPEPCVHSHVHMDECPSAGLQGPRPHLLVHSCISPLLDFGYPSNCHIPYYLVLSPSSSQTHVVTSLARAWEQASQGR